MHDSLNVCRVRIKGLNIRYVYITGKAAHWRYRRKAERRRKMDLVLVAAYLFPFLFLAVFIGRINTRFVLFILWGFIAAVPAYFLEQFLFSAAQNEIPGMLASLTISPVVEEFFKALPLIIIALAARRQQDRDIFLYAMASGIGFAIIETGLLVSPDPLVILIHSFSTALMHGCTCGIIGYGIVVAGHFTGGRFPPSSSGFSRSRLRSMQSIIPLARYSSGSPGSVSTLSSRPFYSLPCSCATRSIFLPSSPGTPSADEKPAAPALQAGEPVISCNAT